MMIVALLYEGFTMLDLVGPIEVLSMMPDAEVRIVAKEAGVVWPDNQAVPFVAPFGIADVRQADVVLVPGGAGCAAVAEDGAILDWLRELHAGTQLTCSVCSGSMILGAAGLLAGIGATSHWTALPLLEAYGARPVPERWVRGSARIMTAAGVSAGIDMAFEVVRELAGEGIARAIQLGIEYDPHPPLDSGDHITATPELKTAVLDGTIAFDRRERARPTISGGPLAS
jgi:transcriptional regulator GlxA family with amidase domain